MHADRAPLLRALEQFGAVHASSAEIGAKPLRSLVAGSLEDELVEVAALAHDAQNARHVVAQRPYADLASLGALEPHSPVLQVEMPPAQPERLAETHPLVRQDGVAQARPDGHQRAREQTGVFRWPQGVKRRALAVSRDEALRERVALDELTRPRGERQHARDELRVVPARAGAAPLGNGGHRLLGVRHAELAQRQGADDRVELREPLVVDITRGLAAHMIRVLACQRAVGPALGEFLERGLVRLLRPGLGRAELAHDGDDRLEFALVRLLASALQHQRCVLRAPRPNQVSS